VKRKRVSLPSIVAAALLGGAAAAHAQQAADAAGAAASPPPDGARRQALVRIVRQDCGSCHGMRLTGGLGPALTREAMAERPLDSMVATIYHGRPGTPMPGWKTMISEADALWIAQQLAAGFPEEAKVAR
jgi:cytochrome c55X